MERKTLFKARVGSHLYGVNTENSDEDYVGIFMPLPQDVIGINKMEICDNNTKASNVQRRNGKDDVDDKMYSLTKFLPLLLGNNPNIIELLFTNKENVIETSYQFNFLQRNKDKILCQKVFNTFGGYSYGQKRKLLVKRDRWNCLNTSLDSIEKMYSQDNLQDIKYAINESEANVFNSLLNVYKHNNGKERSFHKGMPLKVLYDKLIQERDEYGWRINTDSFEKLGYDVKFAYHIVRLLHEATELLTNKIIIFPFTGKVYDDIMNIRECRVTFDDLIIMVEDYTVLLNNANESSNLPVKSDFSFFNDWLVSTLLEEWK